MAGNKLRLSPAPETIPSLPLLGSPGSKNASQNAGWVLGCVTNERSCVNGKKILLVDDLTENLQVLGNLLSETEMDLSFATNGEQALQTCRRWQPDLILLDVMMPGMDGYEVCSQLKADAATADIPVIFLTARNDEASVLEGFKKGGADYLTKPVRQGELLARLRLQLELKAARDSLIERNRDLIELNGSLHRMLSVLSHDLKGPLGSILALIDLRVRNPRPLTEVVALQSFLDLLAKSLRGSLEMLEHILAWSRSKTGSTQPRMESLGVSDCIEGVTRVLDPVARAKGVDVSRIVPEDLSVMADREMLRTVLHNLLTNAIKFSNPGGRIQLEAVPKEEQVCIRVKDEGVGMSEAELSMLFRPDRPVSTPGTMRERGSGFGLLLSREFVSRMGGGLQLSGARGEGLTAEVTLPTSSAPTTGAAQDFS